MNSRFKIQGFQYTVNSSRSTANSRWSMVHGLWAMAILFLIGCSEGGNKLAGSQQSVTPTSSDLMLTDTQMRLANITTQKVSLQSIGQTIVINGRFVANEERTNVISSRATGRIEKLFIKETGRSVTKGEPLYELYSETLLTLQQEYLLAKEQYETLGKSESRYQSFLKSSEKKLLLYGLTEKQVQQLAMSKSATPRITFLSPASGVITEVTASEGQYLPEGGALYKLEDLTQLWLEAELYPQESGLVSLGDAIEARINGESNPVKATVTFLSPEYRANTQLVIMRAVIPNTSLTLKPGMQAQVVFSHSARKVLAIPANAVIRSEKGAHVYVQTDINTFQPRKVKTGLEDFINVEIAEGLKENEVIAVSGAYLLYSELILKKGADPMSAHTH